MEHDKQPTPSDSSGVTRRDLVASTAGLVIAGVSGTAAAASSQGHGQLGVNGAASGIELLAQIGQQGQALTACGYLTMVNGLSLDALYFSGTDRTEATARFTFYGTATVATIQTRDTMIVAIANGHVDFYLRDAPGASFDLPTSFAQGQRIAGDDAALQNVLNVTGPGVGVTTVFADMQRNFVAAFQLDGTRYQLGRMGLRSRMVAPGKSTRIEPTLPTSVEVVAGNITNPE
jgi:hypothetical protein